MEVMWNIKKVFYIRRFSEIAIEIVEWMNDYIPQKTKICNHICKPPIRLTLLVQEVAELRCCSHNQIPLNAIISNVKCFTPCPLMQVRWILHCHWRILMNDFE